MYKKFSMVRKVGHGSRLSSMLMTRHKPSLCLQTYRASDETRLI